MSLYAPHIRLFRTFIDRFQVVRAGGRGPRIHRESIGTNLPGFSAFSPVIGAEPQALPVAKIVPQRGLWAARLHPLLRSILTVGGSAEWQS